MTLVPQLDFHEGTGPETYWKLVQALQNLLNDDPQSPELFDQRHEADSEGNTRPIRINQSNVAIESGNLARRKLIAGKTPVYPKLAAYIAQLRPTHGLSENTTARLRRQAEEIAELSQKVRVLRSRMFAMINEKSDMEVELRSANEQIQRLRARAPVR